MTYQLTAAALGLILAVIILFLVRRDHLQVRYALFWLATAGGALFFGLFPTVVDTIAPLFGVAYPPVLLLLAALAILTVKVLLLDLEHTRQERTIRRLAQRMAQLDLEVRRLRREPSPTGEKNGTGPAT